MAVRARIVLEAERGHPNTTIARTLGIAPETAARWRDRFRATGLDGLRHEAPRAGASYRIPRELVEQILRATLDGRESRDGAWSTRSLARELSTNHMTVHRIWKAYGLANSRERRPPTSWAVHRVDLLGVLRAARVSAIVFGRDGPASPSANRRAQRSAAPDARRDSPAPAPREAATRLVASLRSFPPPAASFAPSDPSASLLVFLRAIEQQTPKRIRLDAIFDRPLSAIGPRVAAWLDSHPRYRVFTSGDPEEWMRSAEAWLERWESVRLHPGSLEGIRLFGEAAQRDGPPGIESARPTWRARASAFGGRGPRVPSRGPSTLPP